jgi:hypothetical protein
MITDMSQQDEKRNGQAKPSVGAPSLKIKTNYWAKPIPDRSFDWCAYDAATYEPGCPIGYGATEQEAIADLMKELEFANA